MTHHLSLKMALAALVFGVGATGAGAETLSFQEGISGYKGTQDLHLSIPENFTGNGHMAAEFTTDPENPVWEWDTHQTSGEGSMVRYSESPRYGLGDHVGLLRFRNVFGTGTDQIPPGSTISSATLTLRSKNSHTGDSANVHRVVAAWDETTRWNDFGIDPGPDYAADFLNAIETVTGSISGGDVVLDVTESVTAWSADPDSNRGWLFMPTYGQDIITVTGSSLVNVTSITVDIEITTPQRGEIAASLRHEEDVAVLINRLGRSGCDTRSGTGSNDIDVTLDPNAAEYIHDSSSSASPLTGTWRPDAYCISDQPLCTESPPGGLCGKPADGEWVLQLADEYIGAGANAELVSWSIHLSDGVTTETYSSSPALVIEKRHTDGGVSGAGKTAIYSSEYEIVEDRPELNITFTPALFAAPSPLSAVPSSGSQTISVQIPDGSGSGYVTVTSSDGSVANPTNSPLHFFAGGTTHLDLVVDVGSTGSATLTLSTSNDTEIEIPNIEIPVVSAIAPVGFSSNALYSTLGDPNPTISVQIPLGSNAASDVEVEISSSNPAVADALGTLTLVFAAGTAPTQNLEIDLGSSTGSATLTAHDVGGALPDGSLLVVVREDLLFEYDLHIEPYVQIGNPTLGATEDQLVVAWETLTRRTGGPNADRFEVQYRRVDIPSWTTVAVEAPTTVDSPSRLHHSVTISGLDFDADYEYRVVHLRNGAALPDGTFQETTSTRPTSGAFRFTAFGNSGLGSPGAIAVANRLTNLAPDLHLLLGDNVYNYGQVEHYAPRIFNMYDELTKSVPFVMTVGNHEAAGNLHSYTPKYFHLPENGPAAVDPEYTYSFDFGNVHFVGIKTGHGKTTLETDVSDWLAADLAASTQTWKIVFSHELPVTRDPYGVDRGETAQVRDHVLAVAVEAGADLYIGGSNHSFQRYLPITAVTEDEPFVEWATCDQGFGTTLVYAGGGAWYRGIPGPIPEQLDPPMEFYLPAIGVGVFDVDGETLTATMVDTDGGIMDQIVLNKCATPEACPCDDTFFLYGTAHGNGNVEVVLDEILISVTPSYGTTAAQVLADLAALINADADLAAQGITASVVGNLLDVTAPVQSSVITDTGLANHPTVPVLSPISLTGLVAALVGAAFAGLRRRRQR